MKVIDEKGRLFGLINIVDLLVLLAVLLVAAGLLWKVFGTKVQEISAPTTEITVTLRTRGAYMRHYNEATAHPLPSQLVSGNGYVDGAMLVEVRKETYIVQVPTAEGNVVDAADPSKIDLIWVIKATVPKNSPIAKIGNQEIRAGRDHIVKTKYLEQIGIIERVEYADETAAAEQAEHAGE